MAKKFIGLSADISEASALTGFLKALSLEIKTARHIGPVLKYTHSLMSQEFTEYMSVIAAAQPSRFHHVYEWGQVGDPGARLWDDQLVGGGNNRVATFRWKASKQVVPVRADFRAKGVKKIHVFVWKAPVMEFATQLTISPKRGRHLAFFTGPTSPTNKYPMKVTQGSIQVSQPGGPYVKGAFTREFAGWWGGAGAQSVFESKVRQVLENDLGRMPIESTIAPFRRARNKKFAMQAVANAEAAEQAGAAAARKYLNARSSAYIEAAKARERIIYG